MKEVQLAKLQLFSTVLGIGAIGVIVYANFLSIKVNKRELEK